MTRRKITGIVYKRGFIKECILQVKSFLKFNPCSFSPGHPRSISVMQGKILVIDDEESLRFTFKTFLSKEGHAVTTAADYATARQSLSAGEFDLVFVDISLPHHHSGIDILREISARKIHCPVIMITGVPNIDTAAESVRLGAYDYVCKPIDKQMLLRMTQQALRHKFLQDENHRIAAEKERYRRNLDAIFHSVPEGILTVDPAMRVIEINDAALGLLCLDARKVVGQNLYELLSDDYAACCHVLQDTLRTHVPVREYRVEWQPENCPRQVVVMNCAPLLDGENRFLGAVLIFRNITRLTELERELKERYRFQNIIGKSRKMQELYTLLEHLADTNTTVLITGESGTGKELVAEALHYNAPGALKPLVKVNCSALAENLLESELFGHVKGAFTGAVKDKIGRFQLADGGTIFLDEIGDLSPLIQIKLLRVLQNKEFERVGDNTPIKVDLRVISATNRNLREKVRQGTFREDLYYRLNVVELTLPPLRERREDIPLLSKHFCEHFNQRFTKHIAGISDEVLDVFMNHAWPGNVRELEHAIEHAFVLCRDDCIRVEHLPPEIRESSLIQSQTAQAEDIATLLRALEKTGWNKAKAARLLGIDRRTIYRKIAKYNLTEKKV